MEKTIEKLREIILNKRFDEKYLIRYKENYEQSLKRHSQICNNCENLEEENLPYDCLCKPSYCIKNDNDFEIILLYEELQEKIEQKNYTL